MHWMADSKCIQAHSHADLITPLLIFILAFYLDFSDFIIYYKYYFYILFFKKHYQGTRYLGWHCCSIPYRHFCNKVAFGVQHIFWSKGQDKGYPCQSFPTLERRNAIIWVMIQKFSIYYTVIVKIRIIDLTFLRALPVLTM